MKTSRFFLMGALAAVVGAGSARAFDPAKGPQQVEVVYFEKEKFTDVKDDFSGTERGRDDILETLKDYIVTQATRKLEPGQKLSVTINEVDLAGEFEPWRGPQWMDVRIVKDIYPPRMNLMFRLTDSEGRVLKEGERKLLDMGFMMKISGSTFRDDPRRHEKDMLNDWINSEFRVDKKKA